MQALVLRGTELPLSLTHQEILESEGFQSLFPMRKTPVWEVGSLVEIETGAAEMLRTG